MSQAYLSERERERERENTKKRSCEPAEKVAIRKEKCETEVVHCGIFNRTQTSKQTIYNICPCFILLLHIRQSVAELLTVRL